MKNILYIILLIIPIFTFGQNEKSKNKIQLGFEIGNKYFHGFSVENYDYTSVSSMVSTTPIETTVYLSYNLNQQNTFSLGLSIHDAFFLGGKITPTLVDYKYFLKEDRNSFFINAGVGYTLFNPTDIRSTVFKLGGGYRFAVTKKKNMHVSVNYDLNKLSNIDILNYNLMSINNVDVNVYAFNVKIGIGF